jgi:hypothetical protein
MYYNWERTIFNVPHHRPKVVPAEVGSTKSAVVDKRCVIAKRRTSREEHFNNYTTWINDV